MAVRTLHDNWRFYYSPNCQMYENVRAGTVFDGDLGVYLERTAANEVEVLDPPADAPAPVVPDVDPLVDPPVVSVESGATVEQDADVDADDGMDGYDPSAFNGAQVIAYVKEHPEEAAAILAAEKSGKQRTTVLAALSPSN